MANISTSELDIAIAGGGIGGLTAALCLQKSGHRVRVFEQQSVPTSAGAGLQLGANALRVFEYLDLLPEISAVAVQPSKVLFRDFRSGDTLYDMTLGDDYRSKYGLPYLHIHRADLLNILHQAWSRRVSNGTRFGARVVGFNETEQGVWLSFDGNNRAEMCDLLVVADGIRSASRAQIVGEVQPRYTGNMAWRATVPRHALPAGWMETIASNFVGPKKHAVLYYVRNGQLANFVGVVERQPPSGAQSWVSRGRKLDLQADFAGWHKTVQSMIEVIPEDACYCWDLYDHAPLPRWSSARVTLLGDAAHATLPFMASGAALAIEDGRILQRAIEKTDSLEQALQCYQRNRQGRTSKVQQSSIDFGKIYHIEQGWVRRLAFTGIRAIGPFKERFLPGYDPNRVPLI